MGKFPKKQKQKKIVEKKSQGSMLSGIFSEQKFPEPVYFQNVDCVALPNFFTPRECRQIIDFAESQGFSTRHRHRVLNLSWTDLVDPYFGEAVWSLCGLGWFLRTITVDGGSLRFERRDPNPQVHARQSLWTAHRPKRSQSRWQD